MTTASPESPPPAAPLLGDPGVVGASLDAFVRYLADDPRSQAVGTALLRGPLALLDASTAIVFAASADRESLRCVAAANYPPALLNQLAVLPVEAHHVACRVLRSGVEEVRSVAEAGHQHPVMRQAAESLRGEIASIPLRSQGETIGVLGFTCPGGLARTWETRRVVDGVVGALSLWVALQRALDTAVALPDSAPLAVTARQRRVLELVREGASNAQIAVLVGYSEKTIKNDLTALYRLLGATSRTDLVARAFDDAVDAG